MQRYFIQLSFNGENYHGWQIQPDSPSVQETLTKALSTILRDKNIEIVGAGRTDAGVHATQMIAHFDTDPINNTENTVKNLNSLLPPDIAVQKIWPVDSSMHARFSARQRTYKYYITLNKSPFFKKLATRIIGDLDFEKMNEAASLLLQCSDFTSFSKLHTDVKTNICHVTHARWEYNEPCWVFTITADRFLRNMVRAIVGTLFEVGRNKISPGQFGQIIEKKDRCSAGTSAPAHGLYLHEITY